jgi:HSP20 family protein
MRITKYVTPITPIDTVFDRLGWGLPALERLFSDRWLGDSSAHEGWAPVRLPRTNVNETPDAYVFSMEMPGLTRKDVEVNLEGDTLVVKGHKEEKQESKDLVRREFYTTSFERSFTVGEGIDRDKVHARMENGVLTVTLPRAAEKLGRKIEVA